MEDNTRKTLRFTLPIIVESTVNVVLDIIASSLISGISKSSLAVVGLMGNLLNVIMAALRFSSSGGLILTARFLGEEKKEKAERTIEQALFLGTAAGLFVALCVFCFAGGVCRLLMPNTEAEVLAEGVQYLRLLAPSMFLLLLTNVCEEAVRASKRSELIFAGSSSFNVVRIFTVWLFVARLQMGIVGAGLSLLLARFVQMLFYFIVLLRKGSFYSLKPSNLLRPEKQLLLRIARIGIPLGFEGLIINVGYLIASSMVMGLGTREATAFQIVNTLSTFVHLPQTVAAAIMIPLIGQALGAGKKERAIQINRRVLAVTMAIITVLALGMAAFGGYFATFYTDDATLIPLVKKGLWVMCGYAVFGLCINVNDPTLRAGGDGKATMCYNILLIFLMRLPLMYLFCYVLNYGAVGALGANVISLAARAACGFLRIKKGKWLNKKV